MLNELGNGWNKEVTDGHPFRGHADLRRRPLEAVGGRDLGRRDRMRLRKIAYALAWLAALAMAVGAGWRPF
jgi:hypothetical protein